MWSEEHTNTHNEEEAKEGKGGVREPRKTQGRFVSSLLSLIFKA
jgi:hypothetical protein